MQFLTPDMVGRIASVAGLDRTVAQRAIGAAVPALLSGLASLASKPDGARELARAVGEQPRAGLDTFADAIGGSRSMIESGKNLLSSLLGGSTVGKLVSAISTVEGIGEGSVKTLMGLLTPAVLGVLGHEQRSAGLDAQGLARMLVSQQDQFAAAMPSELSSMLEAGETYRRQPAEAYRPAASFGPARQRTTASTSSSWAYWVLPLLALAGLTWFLLRGMEPDQRVVIDTSQPGVADATKAAQSLVVGGTDVGRQVVSAVQTLGTNLSNVKDAPSADAALPGLQSSVKELDRLAAISSQLPAEARTTVADFIKASAPRINSAIDTIMNLPGVAAVVKPTIDEMRGKLDTMAMTTGTFMKEKAAATTVK
jgi:hypothetical protein